MYEMPVYPSTPPYIVIIKGKSYTIGFSGILVSDKPTCTHVLYLFMTLPAPTLQNDAKAMTVARVVAGAASVMLASSVATSLIRQTTAQIDSEKAWKSILNRWNPLTTWIEVEM